MSRRSPRNETIRVILMIRAGPRLVAQARDSRQAESIIFRRPFKSVAEPPLCNAIPVAVSPASLSESRTDRPGLLRDTGVRVDIKNA